MKRYFLPLVLALLLMGCAPQQPQPEETIPVLSPVATQPEESPVHTALALTPTDDLSYTLSEPVTGLKLLDGNLLFFSGTENETALTLMDPNTLEPVATHRLPFALEADNGSVQQLDVGISYFDRSTMETVVLDRSLREVRRISAPEDLTGMPLLSADCRTLYYCTPSNLRALDLDSGISRILKEMTFPVQGVSQLLLEDEVLQLAITEPEGTFSTLFLSSQSGQLLTECNGIVSPETAGETYFLPLQEGNLQTLLCGTAAESPRALHSRLDAEDTFFLGQQVLTTGWQEDILCLDLYNLATGLRRASWTAPTGFFPEDAVMDGAGQIWILWKGEAGQLLECLTPDTLQDSTDYTAPYYTRQDPDYDGLAACSLLAESLSEKHGIGILVYKDAVALEPWDYHLEYEYQATVLHRELEALDDHLSRFPEGFLETLAGKFTALKICIVRSAEGTPESGSPEAVNGIQFMDGFDAYIILATDHDTEYALYHELSHLMETVVLTESVAYDRWDNLNPPEFQYDNDYTANQNRDGSSWMKEGSQYFIDTYSMSYAKEDRARLFEYAMTSGHEELFTSPNLQQKLRQLCIGIREGFGLEKSTEILPWEQYLQEPL